MSKTIDFIFDFASPNAYLVHKVLPALLERTGASVRYIPCLLGGIFKATNNKAPFVQFGEIPSKMAYERLEMTRFIKAHSINSFKMNPHFPINTIIIMRAAIVAQQDGALDRYIDVMLSEMWELGTNLGDADTVAAALTAHGFDGAAMIARTQDQGVKDQLAANTEAAVARGAFGIPSFFCRRRIILWQRAFRPS